MAMADLTIVGENPGEGTSKSASVALVQKILDDSGIKNTLGPMSSVLEADADEIWAVIKACQDALFSAGYKAVSISVRMIDKR